MASWYRLLFLRTTLPSGSLAFKVHGTKAILQVVPLRWQVTPQRAIHHHLGSSLIKRNGGLGGGLSFPSRHFTSPCNSSHQEVNSKVVAEAYVADTSSEQVTSGVETSLAPEELCKTEVENLDYLISQGCQHHQLIEAPEVLKFDHSTLERACTLLCDNNRVITMKTVELLSESLAEDQERKGLYAIGRYLQGLDGAISVVDHLCSLLKTSVSEVETLLEKHPRLMKGNLKVVRQKVEVLQNAGITTEEILQSPRVIVQTQVGPQKLQERIQKLQHHNLPLRLSQLARTTFRQFDISIEFQSMKRDQKATKWRDYSRIFEQPEDYLQNIEFLHRYTPESIRPKVEFLRSQGWTSSEILDCIAITMFDLHRIVKAQEKLESNLLDGFSLRNIREYLAYGTVQKEKKSTRQTYKYIASLLGSAHQGDSLLKLLRKGIYSVLLDQNIEVIQENVDYLQNIGFTMETICELPIILGHNPTLLKVHLEALIKSDKMQPLDQWWEKPTRLLNMLQYNIEKSQNFRHPVVT